MVEDAAREAVDAADEVEGVMSETLGLLTLSRVSNFSPFLPGLRFHTMQDLSAEELRRN